MSSIDKGVEAVVRETGRNVQVVHRGNYIVGIINGEEVFRIADRYGYIHEDEREAVRSGIYRYEQRRQREEALRIAREREEQMRREREEAERRAEYVNLQNALKRAVSELAKDEKDKKEAYERAKNVLEGVRRRIESVAKSATMDFSVLLDECNKALASLKSEYERFVVANSTARSKVDSLIGRAKDKQSTQQSRDMQIELRRIVTTSIVDLSSYNAEKLQEKVTKIKEQVSALNEVAATLRKLAARGGEIALIANEALGRLAKTSVSEESDVIALINSCQTAAQKILNVIRMKNIADATSELGAIINAIEVCERINVACEKSTYAVKDFRKEIVQTAVVVSKGFIALREKGYTTCANSRITQIVERCSEILVGSEVGENVYEEVRALSQELEGYEQSDKLHEREHEDYCALRDELVTYGVNLSEIAAFDAKSYLTQKKFLSEQLRQKIRESETSNMIITELKVRSVMEDMGYEVFSTVGDKDGYIVETLYTRKGYDGVLWQIICMADGSIQRRLIGVNKGETQTDPESIKEVAKEMEDNGEPEAFLRACNEAIDGGISVTSAVDHDSDDADEAIRRNGYHHLSPEAAKLYEKHVAIDDAYVASDTEEAVKSGKTASQAKRPTTKVRQVKTTAQNAIQSSAAALRRAAAQSRNMSHANRARR